MIVTLTQLAIGLAILTVGGDLLVRGASKLAAAFGISSLVIGLTIVAFGTSAPEMAVSTISALKGEADIALGNVVGSNIFNVLFILGACAVILPLAIARQIASRDLPIMIAASLAVPLVGWDGVISRLEGVLLFLCIVGYTVALIVQSRRESKAAANAEDAKPRAVTPAIEHLKNIALIVLGLVALVYGSKLFIGASITLAQSLGVSELVIGLTIVAAGTSLPEVATSIIAAIKGERDIAVGNVIGSNIFNVFSVLGLSSALSPVGVPVSAQAMALDIPVMIAVAFICVPFFIPALTLGRVKGAIFLVSYVLYTTYLVLGAQQSAALGDFTSVMTSVVAPVAAVIVIGLWVVEWRAHRARPVVNTNAV